MFPIASLLHTQKVSRVVATSPYIYIYTQRYQCSSQEGISMPLNKGRNIRTQSPTFILFLRTVNAMHDDLLLTFFRSPMRLSAR